MNEILLLLQIFETKKNDVKNRTLASEYRNICETCLSLLFKLDPNKTKHDKRKVWRGFSSIFVNVWNGLKTVVADIVNSWIKSINKIIDTVNNLFHLNWSHIPEIYVSQNTAMTEDARTRATNKQNRITGRASGGMVEMGTMFYAGESGAEVVANIGNKTGVMNVGQLSAGVEDGVMHANETQNALLREIIYIIRNMPRDGSVSGNNGDFITAAQQKNRRDGKTTIPIGV